MMIVAVDLVGHDRSRSVLLVTHACCSWLVPSRSASVSGQLRRGAQRRKWRRLLGPVAVIPLLIGGPVLVLAVWSIAVALTMHPWVTGFTTKHIDEP